MQEPEIHFPPASESNKNKPGFKTILKHLLLFVVTFICVTFLGIIWVGQTANADSYFSMWPEGALFATLLLGFLGAHEFGHYFAAVYHKVKVTLPYFIPIPLGIGTLGAVIKIEERVRTTRKLFDIGITGPIAGFVVAFLVLMYGFFTLPEPSFVENFDGHDVVIQHIQETGVYPELPPEPDSEEGSIMLGNTLLYSFLAGFFDNVPPMYEMYHYPFLFAGWLGLFFTALNLMPVGQLDGGHILYSLIGYKRHKQVARIGYAGLLALAGAEAIPFFFGLMNEWFPGYGFSSIIIWGFVLLFLINKAYNNNLQWVYPVWFISIAISVLYLFLSNGFMNTGSMIWVFWSFFIAYFVKLEHPPVLIEQPLTPGRKILGWISMAIFILCISPSPIYFFN